jgi:hypothetical protein
MDIARDYANSDNPSRLNVIYVIKAETAVPIKRLSAFAKEKEYLILPANAF